MPGRNQPHINAADGCRLSIGDSLHPPGEIHAVSHGHYRQGLSRRQNRTVPGARMVGMAVGDDRPIHRTHRVDVEITRRTIEACGRGS